MKDQLYNIKVWHWSTLLHESKYQFASDELANVYTTGLFDGFKLAGKEPTGAEYSPIYTEEDLQSAADKLAAIEKLSPSAKLSQNYTDALVHYNNVKDYLQQNIK